MLLERICPEIETRLKPRMRGLAGDSVGTYLPQNWVFETEEGSCTLFVDSEGNARVFPGCSGDRDVTIQWSRESLETVLESRGRGSVGPNDYPNVVVHTDKGREWFDFFRMRLGL